MAFDPTVNLGSIITLLTTIGGLFWAYHAWDKKVEIRHVENQGKIDAIKTSIGGIEDRVCETGGDLKCAVKEINKVASAVDAHVQNDNIKHEEFDRRLDRLER